MGKKEAMNEQEFLTSVRKLSNPSDFNQNEGLILNIRKHKREMFLNILLMGANIPSAIKAVDIYFEIHDNYPIDKECFIAILPLFRKFIYLVDQEESKDVKGSSCKTLECDFEKERYGSCECGESKIKYELHSIINKSKYTFELIDKISDLPLDTKVQKYLKNLYNEGEDFLFSREFPYKVKEERKTFTFSKESGKEIIECWYKHGLNASGTFKLDGRTWNLDFTTLIQTKDEVSIDFVRSKTVFIPEISIDKTQEL